MVIDTCACTSSVMSLSGSSAMAAPSGTWPVNRPRNSGASRNRRDTELSTPIASAKQPQPEQWRGELAGHWPRGLGSLGGRGQEGPGGERSGGGDDDEHADQVRENCTEDGVDPSVGQSVSPMPRSARRRRRRTACRG